MDAKTLRMALRIALVLAAAGVVLYGVRALHAATRRADAASTALLLAQAHALDLETTLADTAEAYADLLSGHESKIDSLIMALDGARARSASLTTFVAEAAGESSTDTVFVEVDAETGLTSRISFEIIDPPYRGMHRCGGLTEGTPACRVWWNVTASGRLLHTVAADGTLFVTAESTDRRVKFHVEALEWVPPAPTSSFLSGLFGGRRTAFVAGLTLGALAGTVILRD